MVGPRRTDAPAPSSGGRGCDRGLLRVIRLLVLLVVVCGVAVGAALYGPALADLADEQTTPSPSSDPPAVGDRNPDVTDPDDPGESTYETTVEKISSDTVEDFVHAEVNDRRAEHGLESIEWDGTVASVSRAHSVDMYDTERFDHTNADGEQPYERFQAVADYCHAYGENIAMTWVDRPIEQPGDDGTAEYQTAEGLAEGLVDQWMNSTPHRQAILEETDEIDRWDRAGVGVYIADDGEVYATHNFCTEW